jgi:hypothetical protein
MKTLFTGLLLCLIAVNASCQVAIRSDGGRGTNNIFRAATFPSTVNFTNPASATGPWLNWDGSNLYVRDNGGAVVSIISGSFFSAPGGGFVGGSFTGVGTALTALNASELTSGTVPMGRVASSTNSQAGPMMTTDGATRSWSFNASALTNGSTTNFFGAGTIPISKLARGTPNGTKFINDAGDLATPAAGAAAPFTNTIIGYGDGNATNTVFIGPNGVIISNALGSWFFNNAGYLMSSNGTTASNIFGLGGSIKMTGILTNGIPASGGIEFKYLGSATLPSVRAGSSGMAFGVAGGNVTFYIATEQIASFVSDGFCVNNLISGSIRPKLGSGVSQVIDTFFDRTAAGNYTMWTNMTVASNLKVTNGVSSFSTVAATAIDATGWTNVWQTNNATVYVTATAVAFTIKNRANATIYTSPTLTATMPVSLQPGWSVNAASGLSGTALPW